LPARLAQDVPPFMLVDGNPLASSQASTAVGLRRRDFSAERMQAIKQMHRLLYREGPDAGCCPRAIADRGGVRTYAQAFLHPPADVR
jgi:UDP-N-acetylglucosamine acyltransferase